MMKRASVLLDDRCSKIRGGTFHSFANVTLRKYSKAMQDLILTLQFLIRVIAKT
ncbi:MAG: hypothetical protein MZV64_21715 [Ignavibacteriales bacterium]|nr:hypothetical protein [Ignavibacteriales bacterium]